jgi:hypothetical protein
MVGKREILTILLLSLAASPVPSAAARGEEDPLVNPGRVAAMGFAYHSNLDKYFVYGGRSGSGVALDTTWSFTPSTGIWSQLTANIGAGRSSTRMVYNATLNFPLETSGVLVVYGGNPLDPNTYFFNGNPASDWQACSLCAQDPNFVSRASEALAYDSNSDVVVTFGGTHSAQDEFGSAPTSPLSDTWTLQGTSTDTVTWVQCTTVCGTPVPAPRISPGMDFNQFTLRTILFGGRGSSIYGDTWRYDHTDPTDRWSECTTQPGCRPINSTNCSSTSAPPCTRFANRMTYYEDTVPNRGMVMFGESHDGSTLLGDTWLYIGNPGIWQRCDATHGCPGGDLVEARCCVGMLYDSVRDRVVLFGGQTSGGPPRPAYGDMWTWSFSAGWTCISPTLSCNSEGS